MIKITGPRMWWEKEQDTKAAIKECYQRNFYIKRTGAKGVYFFEETNETKAFDSGFREGAEWGAKYNDAQWYDWRQLVHKMLGFN